MLGLWRRRTKRGESAKSQESQLRNAIDAMRIKNFGRFLRGFNNFEVIAMFGEARLVKYLDSNSN